MTWESIQQAIRTCRRCEDERVPNLRVPSDDKRRPLFGPRRPVRLYFVSVAPPWGGAYFWDETQRDAVRDGLFAALCKAGARVENCREFVEHRLFLTPAVKCPSENDGKDHHPAQSAIKNCGSFLRSELFAAQSERILALGSHPFEALRTIFGLSAPKRVADFRKGTWWVRVGERDVPLSGTFFPGNNRHKGFELIIQDIARMLTLAPRNIDA
jgi:uracil-DNA glycosylase